MIYSHLHKEADPFLAPPYAFQYESPCVHFSIFLCNLFRQEIQQESILHFLVCHSITVYDDDLLCHVIVGSVYSFDEEWDDDSDDGKSTGGYGGSQVEEGGTMQRGGGHSTMKIK